MRKTIITALTLSLLVAASATTALAFGSIAVNDEQGMSAEEAGYGLGWGASEKEAEANAINECKSADNDDCKIALTFEQCGAYVGDRVNYGTGKGTSKKDAETQALESCPNCKVVVSECQ